MKFDNLFFHCSSAYQYLCISQPGKRRLYGDRNVQAEQPGSYLIVANFNAFDNVQLSQGLASSLLQ